MINLYIFEYVTAYQDLESLVFKPQCTCTFPYSDVYFAYIKGSLNTKLVHTNSVCTAGAVKTATLTKTSTNSSQPPNGAQPRPILKNGNGSSAGVGFAVGAGGVNGLLMPTNTQPSDMSARAMSAERLHLIGGVPSRPGIPAAGGEVLPVSRERLAELLERATLNRSFGVGAPAAGGDGAGLTFEQRLRSLEPLLAQHSGHLTLPPNLSTLAQMSAAQRPLLPVRERDEERDESDADADDAELTQAAEMQQRTHLLPPSYTNPAPPAALLLKRPHSAAAAPIPRLRTNPFFGTEGRLQADSLLPATATSAGGSALAGAPRPKMQMPLPVSVPVVGSLKRTMLSPAAALPTPMSNAITAPRTLSSASAASACLPPPMAFSNASLSLGLNASASAKGAEFDTTGYSGTGWQWQQQQHAQASAAPPYTNEQSSRASHQPAPAMQMQAQYAGSSSSSSTQQQAAMPAIAAPPVVSQNVHEDRSSRRRRRRVSSKVGAENGSSGVSQCQPVLGYANAACAPPQPAAALSGTGAGAGIGTDALRNRPPLAIPVPYPMPLSALQGPGSSLQLLQSMLNAPHAASQAAAVPTQMAANQSIFPRVHEIDSYVLKQ